MHINTDYFIDGERVSFESARQQQYAAKEIRTESHKGDWTPFPDNILKHFNIPGVRENHLDGCLLISWWEAGDL